MTAPVESLPQHFDTFIRLSQRKLIIDKIGDKCLLRAVLSRNALMETVRQKKAWVNAALRKEREEREEQERMARDAVTMEVEDEHHVKKEHKVADMDIDASSNNNNSSSSSSSSSQGDNKENKHNTEQGAEQPQRTPEDEEEGVIMAGKSPIASQTCQQISPSLPITTPKTTTTTTTPVTSSSSPSPSHAMQPVPLPLNRLKRCHSDGDQALFFRQHQDTKKQRTLTMPASASAAARLECTKHLVDPIAC